MKVAIFGSESDCHELRKMLESVPVERNRSYDGNCIADYDDLCHALAKNEYELVIVLANGAQGMEACIGTRKIKPHIPLFWFSDDQYFGPQSYRLDCTYFSTKPVTVSRLQKAFELLFDGIGISGSGTVSAFGTH